MQSVSSRLMSLKEFIGVYGECPDSRSCRAKVPGANKSEGNAWGEERKGQRFTGTDLSPKFATQAQHMLQKLKEKATNQSRGSNDLRKQRF